MYAFTTEANCTSVDPEAFFSQAGGAYENINVLKRVCANCTVVNDCLEYALENMVQGYWGNTTEHERSRIRSARGIIGRPLHLDWL